MAKKTVHRPAKAKAQKPRRRPQREVVTVERLDVVAAQAVKPYEAPFLAWLTQTNADDPDGDSPATAAAKAPLIWSGVVAASTYAAMVDVPPDPARWTPRDLADLLDTLSGVSADGGPPLAPLTHSLFLFLAFLADTGRWRGSQSDLQGCQALLGMEVDPDSELGRLAAGMTAASDVDPDQEDHALAALPLTADILALLRWVRARRAAELAGEVAEDDGPTLEEDLRAVTAGGPAEGEEHDALAVRHLWATAQVTRLVSTEGQVTDLTDVGSQLAESEDLTGDAADDVRRAVCGWLLLLLTIPSLVTSEEVAEGVLGPLVGSVLAHGMVEDHLTPADVGGDAAGLDVPTTQREGVLAAARQMITRLLRAGLLEESADGYVIPAGLAGVVAWTLSQVAAHDAARSDSRSPHAAGRGTAFARG